MSDAVVTSEEPAAPGPLERPTQTRPGAALRAAAISQVGRQIVQLATIALLARLVAPAEFGLVGMAAIVVAAVGLFRDLGTASALIQRSDLTPRLVSTVFWVNVTIGVVAAAGLWLLAPAVAEIFSEPRVEPVLRVLALNPLLSSLGLAHQVLLERGLRFGSLLRVEVASVLCGAAVALALALSGAGVWSLVAQTLTQTAVTTAALWAMSGWRPQRAFSVNDVRSVGRFSLGVSGAMLFNYVARNADYVLIGRFLGAEQLGFYTIAYRMMLYPLQHVTHVTTRVMYPAYARVQHDDAEMRRLFLAAAGGIALLTMPIVFGIMATTGPLLLTLLGPTWGPAIPVLAVLAPVALIHTVGTTTGAVYQAKGRSDTLFIWGAVSSILTVAAFVVGLQWGIVGVAGAYLAVTVALAYPMFAIPMRYIGLRVRDVWRAVSTPFLISLAMFCIVFAVTNVLLGGSEPGLRLVVGVILGSALYVTGSWFFDRERIRSALSLIHVGARA